VLSEPRKPAEKLSVGLKELDPPEIREILVRPKETTSRPPPSAEELAVPGLILIALAFVLLFVLFVLFVVGELAVTWLILAALAFVVFLVVEDWWKHFVAKR